MEEEEDAARVVEDVFVRMEFKEDEDLEKLMLGKAKGHSKTRKYGSACLWKCATMHSG